MKYLYENPFDPLDNPNCYKGHEYAQEVVKGIIPNSVYLIGACRRYLKFLEKAQDPENYYYFNTKVAERYLKRVQQFKHVKGKWLTPNIVYNPWQCWLFMNIKGFLWRGIDNPLYKDCPLFRVIHIEVPRGNAKSAMASQMLLNELALEDPHGNEISCFATKSDQARIVLDSARVMAKNSQDYLDKTGVKVLEHKIVHPDSSSFARPMSSDDKSLDGLNDKLSVLDELHAMSRDLFEVVSSGTSKRRDSIMLCITTAGGNTDSVGYEQSNYAKKVSKGEVEDDQMFCAVYTIDDGDDIYDPLTWRKANPNWGHSVDPITFEAKAKKASITPSDVANFKIKHLNCWINEAKAYFSLTHLAKCKDETLKIEDFLGMKAYAALDLASKVDLASEVVVFRKEGIYYAFDKSYIPQNTVDERKSPLYDKAIAEGTLIPTPGAIVSFKKIKEDFVADNKKFKMLANHYDPWNATQFAQECMDEEFIEMTEFRMNTGNMSEATKELDAAIRAGNFRYNSLILEWCIGNVVCKQDNNENVYPRKSSERSKIDAAVALIMAIAGWVQVKDDSSVYEDRGIRVIDVN